MMRLLFIFLLVSATSNAQIIINEFSAANSSTIEDPDYNEYSDWIELYNTSNETVNLNGYSISDDFDSPEKWTFSNDLYIEPNGFILLWADGNESGIHLGFKLSSDGEEIILHNDNMELLDSVSFSTQSSDISYGRRDDGSLEWAYFPEPTPGSANTTTAYNGIVMYEPEFNTHGGFFTESISVSISSIFSGDIRYTSNGDSPTINDPLFTAPIDINETTILRARIFIDGLIPGPIITQSYFINENSVLQKLPVVSIATEERNFWNPTDGIYMQDFKPLWEVPINIEFFENKGADRAAFNERAGTKVNGLYSWQLPQKMLGVYFRKEYGSSSLGFPIFSQRERSEFDSFALRASGSDWSYTLFRDILGQHSTLLNMSLDIMSFRPAIVYVNGEFLGIHNMREKVNDDYIESSYGLESGTFDLIENEDYAEEGDLTEYNKLSEALDKSLSRESNYNDVSDLMDIENFTEFAITEIATGNRSIDHNIMAWKPKDDGKWKWIVMDLDRGFFSPTEYLIEYYLDRDVIPLNDLFDNDSYVSYFGKQLASHLYTSFHPDQIEELINEHSELIEDEMPRHIERWKGTTSNYGNAMPSVEYWENQVDNLKAFANERPKALLTDLGNYGFNGTINLSLSTYPEDAGTFYLNEKQVPFSNTTGLYLKNSTASLEVLNKPGYKFIGFSQSTKETIIEKESNWKYFDEGTSPGVNWYSESFDDDAWSTGQAPLGYDQGNENTTISYGDDENDKHITSYFRTSFELSDEDTNAIHFIIRLLKDDGVIIYINGEEVTRSNMPTGEITSESLASLTIKGTLESVYDAYLISTDNFKAGTNVIAVELHQDDEESPDLNFDLELSAFYNSSDYISDINTVDINSDEDIDILAVFEETGECIVPEQISSDLTLYKDCSPYIAQGDIIIDSNATLSIEAGVEILMPGEASITINGAINANGTDSENIIFSLNPDSNDDRWGILNFKNTSDTSVLKYIVIEQASKGEDPTLESAAISCFNTVIIMDYLTIENVYANPIVARYSDVTLTNSTLHSEVTGDLINVKYGKAYIENCKFTGNDQPDTDAIDYDEIENGVIKSCEILNFYGSNSDAVDIGEKATNIFIDSLWVNSITDKGISVGQQSTVFVQNSIFVACNMGIAVKDSSYATINKSTFYNNVSGISCFEKNEGKAGGNAIITNNIFSNSSEQAIYYDDMSQVSYNYNLSDTYDIDTINNNITANPQFENPVFSIFNLLQNSPALLSGLDNNSMVDMGAIKNNLNWDIKPIIAQIFVNPLDSDYPEFISIYNPSTETMDLSNYTITKGVTAEFPEDTYLSAYDTLYVSNNGYSPRWNSTSKQILQWSDGKLSNNGENIQLEDKNGIVIDFINYNDSTWPNEAFTGNYTLTLNSSELDNHFSENWYAEHVASILDTSIVVDDIPILMFPNPCTDKITIIKSEQKYTYAYIYNTTGQLVKEVPFNELYSKEIDLSNLRNGLYILRLGEDTRKFVIYK